MNVENTANLPAARNPVRAEETVNRVSPDLIEDKIKANLEPENEQLSTLTELVNQLIQESLASNFLTVGPGTQQTQPRSSLRKEA